VWLPKVESALSECLLGGTAGQPAVRLKIEVGGEACAVFSAIFRERAALSKERIKKLGL
jgi:hypothetical protein